MRRRRPDAADGAAQPGLLEHDDDTADDTQHRSDVMTADNKVAVDNVAMAGGDEESVLPVEETKTGVAMWCAPETSILRVVLKLALCFLAGMVFGMALEKGRVFEPEAIRNQMVFTQFAMLKMFLSAMAVSQLVFAVMSVTPLRHLYSEMSALFMCTLTEKGILTSILGAFLLGVGMTFAGTCPGMVLAQVGSWTTNAVFTLLGALIAALLYGLVGPYVTKITKPTKPFTHYTLHDHTGISFVWFAFPMALLVLGSTVLMEYFIPWQEDLPRTSRNTASGSLNPFLMRAWPPVVAGSLIGLLQLPIVLAAKDTLGGSSAYVTIMSQWVIPEKLKLMFPYLARARTGMGNFWQVFYIVGAMAGAALSSSMSNTFNTVRGVGVVWALIGGFIMLIGARLASGCTSGHGLSGAALLYYHSWIAVPCMFIGGISTAFILQAFEVLNVYVCSDGKACLGSKG